MRTAFNGPADDLTMDLLGNESDERFLERLLTPSAEGQRHSGHNVAREVTPRGGRRNAAHTEALHDVVAHVKPGHALFLRIRPSLGSTWPLLSRCAGAP